MKSWTGLLVAAAALLPPVAASAQGIKLPPAPDRRFETLRLGSALSELRRADSLWAGEDEPMAAAGETSAWDAQTRELASGVYRPLADNLATLLESSYSSGTGLTSEWSVYGQLGARIGEGWGIAAGLRHSEQAYSSLLTPPSAPVSADLTTLSFGRQWNRYRGAYTYYTGRSDAGMSASGHRLQFDFFYSQRSSVGLAYTTGRQLDSLTPYATLNPAADTSNIGVAGEHWFSPTWALNYNALVEDGGAQGLKPELRLGLRVRF
jgi:YaiO family outer membrane protein